MDVDKKCSDCVYCLEPRVGTRIECVNNSIYLPNANECDQFELYVDPKKEQQDNTDPQ